MTKVVKILLVSEQKNKDGNLIHYNEINKILWELQQQTREIKNKAVQLCWEWCNFSSDYHKQSGVYPNEKDILGLTLRGFVYAQFKKGYDLYSKNNSATTEAVCKAFKNAKADIVKGDRSILSYKTNQPLELAKETICLTYKDGEFYVILKLLNTEGKKKYNLASSEIQFKILVKDNSTKTILKRCNDGTYAIAGSHLVYNQKKKLWCLNLSYSFDNTHTYVLDKDKILGVDLGVACPICASIYGDLNRFIIKGGEIEEFRRRVEARKISMLRQGAVCGCGRIGHGIKTRNKPVYKIEDKIARFRDTTNHKYSRGLINFAIKNGCGTIQMEKLTGVTEHANKFLRNWSYYDLQRKIEYKAREANIAVVYVNPMNTSRRCSKCGYIHEDNRSEQAKFKCLRCGFEENADFNASQNLGIKGIERIIEETE